MFHIEADNPHGLNYDEVYADRTLASNAVRTILARGGVNVRVNGHVLEQE